MTVCVAAICEGRIVGASDRMLTAGDIEFEPEQSKIFQLTTSVGCMIAGDSALQAEILPRLRSEIHQRIDIDPENWWLIRDVAALYFHHYAEVKKARIERQLLSPLGLTHESFLSRQKELSPELVMRLSTDMVNFGMPDVETIVCGIDPEGPHIYVVRNSGISCLDQVSFAAVGSGAWHASSQLMFAGHTRMRLMPATLFLVYAAKKRAEVAPGVGVGTDMFIIGPALGNYLEVGTHVLNELESCYQSIRDEATKTREAADTRIATYVEQLTGAAAAPQEQSSPTILDAGTSGIPPSE
jgi:20S proteasome alpha/beta subunit